MSNENDEEGNYIRGEINEETGEISISFDFLTEIHGVKAEVLLTVNNNNIKWEHTIINEEYRNKGYCAPIKIYCLKNCIQIIKKYIWYHHPELREKPLIIETVFTTQDSSDIEDLLPIQKCSHKAYTSLGFVENESMRNNGTGEMGVWQERTYSSSPNYNPDWLNKNIGLFQMTGGFFFNKKKTRKRRKKKTHEKKNKKSKKKRNKKTKKKKDRKWTDKSYPYRNVNNKDAIADFLSLRRMAKGKINPNSTLGNKTVDWGTEKARRKTKYRNHSFVEMWNRKDRRDKMMQFAKRIYKQGHSKTVLQAIKSAIDLQWGTVNTMRAAAAIHMYKKYEAKRVLDFTAGWGARMIAAMALDIDYIGIDSNKSLKPGYEKIIKLLKPYTKSKVKMIWSEAQKVDLSKVGKYDYVFTSPPYEYLEVYENMTNYEKKGSKISQPSSSQKIKLDDSAQFYDEFLVPTLKNAYKYLPKNKYICLNMPDIMYEKIKKRWKSVTKCDDYKIVKRTGGPKGKDDRRGKELIFCWKKR